MKNLTPQQIEGLSINQEKLNTRKEFTPSEMDALRQRHTQLSMDKDDADEEYAEIKKEFSERIKSVKQSLKGIIRTIRYGFEEVSATVYCVPNTETKMIDLYDTKTYELLSSRKPLPEERDSMNQLSILSPDHSIGQSQAV